MTHISIWKSNKSVFSLFLKILDVKMTKLVWVREKFLNYACTRLTRKGYFQSFLSTFSSTVSWKSVFNLRKRKKKKKKKKVSKSHSHYNYITTNIICVYMCEFPTHNRARQWVTMVFLLHTIRSSFLHLMCSRSHFTRGKF